MATLIILLGCSLGFPLTLPVAIKLWIKIMLYVKKNWISKLVCGTLHSMWNVNPISSVIVLGFSTCRFPSTWPLVLCAEILEVLIAHTNHMAVEPTSEHISALEGPPEGLGFLLGSIGTMVKLKRPYSVIGTRKNVVLEYACHFTHAVITPWPRLHVSSRIYSRYRFDSTHVNKIMLQWLPVSSDKCVLGHPILLRQCSQHHGPQ